MVVFLTSTFCKHRPERNIRQPVIPLTDCALLYCRAQNSHPIGKTFEVDIKWAMSCKKVPNVLSRCHTNRRTGERGHRLFRFFFWKSRCHTKRPRMPVLLLVWQWLRKLGIFLHNAAQMVFTTLGQVEYKNVIYFLSSGQSNKKIHKNVILLLKSAFYWSNFIFKSV